jgi:hypothetical protein
MKRLEIKNFDKKVMGIDSDRIKVSYTTDMGDKYVLGVSGKNHYKIAIYKESKDGSNNFTVWVWDMDKNYSYPMSIWMNDLSSINRFKSYLENVVGIADSGRFDGEPGNRVTLR